MMARCAQAGALAAGRAKDQHEQHNPKEVEKKPKKETNKRGTVKGDDDKEPAAKRIWLRPRWWNYGPALRAQTDGDALEPVERDDTRENCLEYSAREGWKPKFPAGPGHVFCKK